MLTYALAWLGKSGPWKHMGVIKKILICALLKGWKIHCWARRREQGFWGNKDFQEFLALNPCSIRLGRCPFVGSLEPPSLLEAQLHICPSCHWLAIAICKVLGILGSLCHSVSDSLCDFWQITRKVSFTDACRKLLLSFQVLLYQLHATMFVLQNPQGNTYLSKKKWFKENWRIISGGVGSFKGLHIHEYSYTYT